MTFTAMAFHALVALVERIEECDNPGDMGISGHDPRVQEARDVIEFLKEQGYEELS
jgi:hypothetical protein